MTAKILRIGLLLGLTASSAPAHAGPTKPPEYLSRFRSASFRVVDSTAGLPEVIRAPLSKLHGRERLSDTSEPFDASCTVDGEQARRHMVTGGVSREWTFIVFETGGRGHSYWLEVFSTRSGLREPVFFASVPWGTGALHDLQLAIDRGKVEVIPNPEDYPGIVFGSYRASRGAA